jgi:lysophospholipase L1-like esterase
MPSHRSRRSKLLLIALALALAVSLGANYLLFRRGEDYYLQLNATRLDPLGLERYPVDAALATPAAPRVVFYGDSRAAQWPAPALEGFEYANRGVGAQTSAQVARRFDAHVRPLAPDVVIIQVGINDLKTIPLFPDRRKSIIRNLQANIRQMVEDATRMGATVILTTIFPAGEVSIERSFFWSSAVDQGILAVNEDIRSLAADRVIVYDSYAALVGEDGAVRPEYSLDLLHLTDAGYARLNEDLARILRDLP